MSPAIPLDRPHAVGPRLLPHRGLARWIAAAWAFLVPRRWHPEPDSRERLPIYRISRVWEDRWIVTRPGALIGHSFPNLESAVSFVRHECPFTPAAVELFIGDLYVVAFHDPNDPGSLFGERQRLSR